jgi:hypothetical protein
MFIVLAIMMFMRLEFAFHYSRIGIILLILVVLLPVVFEIGRTMIIGSSGGLLQDLSRAQAGLSANNFAARWSTLKDTVFFLPWTITEQFYDLIPGSILAHCI